MKISDCEEFRVSIFKTFNKKYRLTDDILLNTIEVDGLNDNAIDRKVDFEIKNISDVLTIYPLDNCYEEYMIRYCKLVKAKKIEINREDIFEHFESDDNYVFYIKEEQE